MLKVFPTETVARSHLVSIAKKNADSAFWADNFISWDTFKRSCITVPEKLEKVSYIHKKIFAESFLKDKKHCMSLKYFYNQDYPETLDVFSKIIANSISLFKRELHRGFYSSDIQNDMRILVSSYEKFLQENGLYDEDYLIPDFSKAPENTVLYYASAIQDPYVCNAVDCGLKTVESNSDIVPVKVYENTVFEIKDTFKQIRKLLSDHVNASDIALTCASFNECSDYIIEEAKLNNISLNITAGKKLSQYECGKFFAGLSSIVNSLFSFEEMKKFLLNTSFPFCDRNLLLSIIKNGVELKIKDGGKNAENWVNKFTNAGLKNEADFVGKFAEITRQTVCAKTIENLKLSIRLFQDSFIENASWDSTERNSDIMAFERCMKVLDDIEKCPYYNGNLYALFLNVLENTVYVVPEENNGVKVYQYPVSCGLNVPYHFVIGLDDRNSVVKRGNIRQISLYENSKDITECVINSYCIDGVKTVFSCAEETFSSSVSAPPFFEKNGKKLEIKGPVANAFSAEENMWKDCSVSEEQCTQIQKQLFDNAVRTTIANRALKETEFSCSKVKLSATSMKEYEACPFKWMLMYSLGIEDLDFAPLMNNALDIGNILHNTYEKYLNEKGMFTEDNQMLEKIFRQELYAYSCRNFGSDRINIEHIESKYSDILSSLFTAKTSDIFTDSLLVKTEQKFTYELNGATVNGSVDLILKTPSGDYLLIDFKKGKAPDSTQLLLYAKATEKEYGKLPVYASYYSVEKQSFSKAFASETECSSMLAELSENVKTIVKNITDGKFETADNADSCINCSYRRICRRRYVIK